MSQGSLPAARTARFKNPRYNYVRSNRNAQTITMSGVDLVQPIPRYNIGEVGADANIFLTVPANPLYWKGTRIAAQASAYQQYRPLKFSVKYVPSVPVTTAGQIVYGTLWNVGVPTDSLQQSLATSNGGGISTVYQYAWSHVRCTRQTLPLRFYNTGDDMAENTTCPFVWVAYYTGSQNVSEAPGYVILHWKYEFTVGIGQTSRNAVTLDSASQTQALQLAHEKMGLRAFPWGVAIGVLKTFGQELLRKVAIFLLETTLTYLKDPSGNDNSNQASVNVGAGNILNYDLNMNSKTSSNLSAATYSVLEMNGNRYFVPDTTKCIVWMCGSRVETTQTREIIVDENNKVSDIYDANVLVNGTRIYMENKAVRKIDIDTYEEWYGADTGLYECKLTYNRLANEIFIEAWSNKEIDATLSIIIDFMFNDIRKGNEFTFKFENSNHLPKQTLYFGPTIDFTDYLAGIDIGANFYRIISMNMENTIDQQDTSEWEQLNDPSSLVYRDVPGKGFKVTFAPLSNKIVCQNNYGYESKITIDVDDNGATKSLIYNVKSNATYAFDENIGGKILILDFIGAEIFN